MTTIQIKHRYTGDVLYECEAPQWMGPDSRMRYAIEKAVAEKKSLRGANLRGANLSHADLRNADLRDADLCSASLRCAHLYNADLRDANMTDADLHYADLRYADLVEIGKLDGERPVLTIGPIGSRGDYLTVYITEAGLYVRTGCFFGTLDQFELAVASEHGNNKHGREYAAAVALIKAHAEIWAPKQAEAAAAQKNGGAA